MSLSKDAVRDCTDEFVVEDAAPAAREGPAKQESDPHRIAQRQKQVDLGKNTLGYQRYRQQVPRNQRGRNDPVTPNVYQVCSKRSFDGQIKKWRRMLHAWDPKDEGEESQEAPATNPPAPASEPSYEHITHEDCAEEDAPAAASPGPKNGRSLRPATAGQPQKANHSALRKRNFSESAMTCQPSAPGMPPPSAPPSSKQAKTLTPLLAPPSKVAVAPSPAAGDGAARQEGEERDVDFGEDEDWAYIDADEAAAAAVGSGGAGTTVYNNFELFEQDDGGLDDIMV